MKMNANFRSRQRFNEVIRYIVDLLGRGHPNRVCQRDDLDIHTHHFVHPFKNNFFIVWISIRITEGHRDIDH